MLMLFVCFSVFFCVGFKLWPAGRARLYGVIHAGGILIKGLEKEKPTVGKKSGFFQEFRRQPKICHREL
jgi:hypothetical protein